MTTPAATGPAPSPGTWLRPRITFAACLEVGGRWWLITLCGFLLMSALLLSLQRTQIELLREARMEIALQALRERLETNLSLGFELADSEHTQALLEDLLTDDPSLLAAEVFDASAISLFNTDRGAIGEPVPSSWLTASLVSRPPNTGSSPGSRAWAVTNADSVTLGLPIKGPFGEVTGHVSITSTKSPAPTPWTLLLASALALLLLSGATWMLTVWLLRALAKEHDHAGMALAEMRLLDAEARLSLALRALKRNEDNT